MVSQNHGSNRAHGTRDQVASGDIFVLTIDNWSIFSEYNQGGSSGPWFDKKNQSLKTV